jgi:hypothetical protein
VAAFVNKKVSVKINVYDPLISTRPLDFYDPLISKVLDEQKQLLSAQWLAQ